MNLFSTRRKRHIDGHKHPSCDVEARVLDINQVPFVYFPLVGPRGAKVTKEVSVGDKVKVGQRIAVREGMVVPFFASVSGTVVEDVVKFSTITNSEVPHLVIKNDFKMEKESSLKPISKNATREEIVEAIKNAGLVGLGGAGFPTYIKYNNVKDIETVLINAVECEPFLTTDFKTTINEAEALMKGILLLIKAADAQNAIIAIKKGKTEAINAINDVIGNYPSITLRIVPDAYPMGWERTLIYEVFKREYGMLTAEAHVIVNNSQTAIQVYRALVEGEPVINRLMTVSGDVVSDPANIIVPVGTPAETVLSQFSIKPGKKINLLAGGPMTSGAITTLDFVTLPQMGGFTVLQEIKYRAIGCLRCGECTANCPAAIQPVEIKIAYEKGDIQRLKQLDTLKCISCGLCSYVCPSRIEVTDFMNKAKGLLFAEQARNSGK